MGQPLIKIPAIYGTLLQAGTYLTLFLLLVRTVRQDSRKARSVQQAFRNLGIERSISLGLCLSGLSNVDPTARVSCGMTATELILLAEPDGREAARILSAAIRQIFGGDYEETQRRLEALAAFPALILAQSVDGRHYERKRNVSYLTIDWQDPASGRQQLVFEMRGKGAATVWANYLAALSSAKRH